MANVTLKGNPVRLAGELPAKGAAAPDFTLVKQDLSAVSKKDLAGKTVVLLTVPSVDTGVCATETRKFNEKAASIPGATVIVASSDLPFAIKRFCAAEGIANVQGASDVRDRDFGRRWGVAIADGPLAGVTARAAFVIDPKGTLAVVAGGDGTARMYKPTAGDQIKAVQVGSPVFAVAIDPAGKRIATGAADGTVKLWDAAGGQELDSLPGHLDSIQCLAFSPDGSLIASGGWDHSVRLWDAAGRAR